MLNVTAIKFNEGTAWITTEEKVVVDREKCMLMHDEDGATGLLHYGISEDGVVSFGIWYEEERRRPGHGGYWSSRAGVVAPLIGVPMVDVVINRTAMHMTVPAVEALLAAHGLDSDYCVAERNSYGETVYEVVKAIGFCHIHQEKLYGGELCYTCEDMAETEQMIMEDN
jgi:hypothetical protein